VAILCTPLLAQRPASTPLASVDGVTITAAELDSVVGSMTWPLEERLFQIRKQAVDALIKQRLLEREAARRKISMQALIDTEVTAKVSITDEEVDRIKAKSDAALSRDDIRKALLKEKIGAELTRFVSSLERKSTVRVLLEAPRAPRSILEPAKAPSKGPANAPVTIVEFTDFHCSHCREAEAVLSQVMSSYPVRLVHRDLPLEAVHPHAREAHEAARCAEAQGRFWPYRESLFAGEPKTGDALKASARSANLDLAAYDRCIAAGSGRAAIDADAADAKRLGVKTTPTFFVNGRELEGPATLDAFAAAIRNELPRSSRAK
jgi:protein-disulfide isomerase